MHAAPCAQTPCQVYWKELLKHVEEGKLHPDMVITHKLPLKDAAHGFKIFNNKEDGCVKVRPLICGRACVSGVHMG